MKKFSIPYMVLAIALLSSCSHKGWKVEGTITDAPEGMKVAVEGFNAGMWYTIDSVAIKHNGSFAYTSPQGSPYPDIYRLSYEGRSIYFPIDSIETVTIAADAAKFDTDYSLAGSQVAEDMLAIDQKIAKAIANYGTQAVLTDSLLKRDLSIAVNEDQSGILGYYIINKTIGGQPLFSVDNKTDLRIIGALANKFVTLYPDDPRTVYLCARFLQARQSMSPAVEQVYEATESGLLDIELYDARGQKQKLSDLSGKGAPVLLSFTSYQIEPSIPYNVELNRLYEKYKGQGLNIYQVSVDGDEVQWRQSANNLPWTAVWYDGYDNGNLLRLYNVATIPTTFIIDRNGDLVERVEDPSQIESKLRLYM